MRGKSGLRSRGRSFSVHAWGENISGQLGDGTATGYRSAPATVTGGSWRHVSAGGRGHSHAIKDDGTLWGWGVNNYGQLGDGSQTQRLAPVKVDGQWEQTSSCGTSSFSRHTLAVRSDKTLWSWGYGFSGQLGDGTQGQQSVRVSPGQVGTQHWLSVAAGGDFSLGIRDGGRLYAWGDNYAGQLGDGTTERRLVPTAIGSGTWSVIDAGEAYAAAIRSDGKLFTWGSNGGKLGDGTTVDRAEPVEIDFGNWISVACGFNHTMAVRNDGTLWSWGNNSNGQLGIGSLTSQLSPVQVGSATTWKKVFIGRQSSFGIKEDGTLWAWGRNEYSQLGDGTTTQQLSPVQIGSDQWNQLAAGERHTVAIKETL